MSIGSLFQTGTLECSQTPAICTEKSGRVQDQQNPTWQVRHRGAWVGSTVIRKSKTSTFQVTESTCTGTADTVLRFWQDLGFKVTCNLEKAGTKGIGHSGGYAVDICWCKVRRGSPAC